MNCCNHLVGGHTLFDIDKRWKCRWRAGAIDAVAHGALTLIDHFAGTTSLAGNQPAGPGHLSFVDVDDAVNGIDRGTTPFSAAIEAGKDDRLLADGERIELAAVAECA